MRKLLRYLCMGLIAGAPAALALPPSSEQHDRIAPALAAQGLTGAVWALVDGGEVAVGAAGLKNAATGAPLAPEDRVHVGSIAKTVLATGVLRLVTQGRLALDTPVREILPDVAFDNPWDATDPVRVRHLLDHTAGLEDLRLWQFFSERPAPAEPLARAFAGDATLLRVRVRPGSRFSYSNMGYTLLGRVVESVTGERYETHLDRELLRPLGLADSTFAFVTQVGPDADPRLAMGHFENGVPQAAVPIYLRPAGQFTTTARDMAVFAQFLMSDGEVDGAPFVAPELLHAMGVPRDTEAALAGLSVGYGLGLATRDRHGVVGRCHGGNVVGYRAMLCIFPEHDRAFFVSTNADSETADYGALDRALVEALALQAAPQPAAAVASATAGTPSADATWDGWYVPEPMRFEVLGYAERVFGAVRARERGAALELTPLGGAPLVLQPLGGGLHRAPDRVGASHVTTTAADGTRVIATGLQSLVSVPAWRLVPHWISAVLGVLGCAYLVGASLVRLVRRRLRPSSPAFAPALGFAALLVPLPLFLGQSILALGDRTPASVGLAIATAALPIALVVGLVQQVRAPRVQGWQRLDVVALVAALQWTLVLAAQGLIPLRLWA